MKVVTIMNHAILWLFFLLLFTTVTIGGEKPFEQLVVATPKGNFPPYEMKIDNKLVGTHIDLIREVAKEQKVTIIFKTVPWPRALMMVKRGKADAITSLTRTKDREKLIYYIEGSILSVEENFLISSKYRSSDINFSGDLKTLRPYKILARLGFSYGDRFDNAATEYLNVHRMSSWDVWPQLLDKRRFDLAVVDRGSFTRVFQNRDSFGRIRFLKHPVSIKSLYFGFSKASVKEKAAKEFSAAMARFKESEAYQRILNTYISK